MRLWSRLTILAFMCGMHIATCAKDGAHGSQPDLNKAPVTVIDLIQATQVAGGHEAIAFAGGALTQNFAAYSPDGRWMLVVVKRGNLEKNTNEYSLLLFETAKMWDRPQARTLVTFSSSSNREAITDVSWLRDSDTILFLGEHSGETRQLYSLRRSSGEINKLTSHATNLLEYSIADGTGRIVFTAEPSPKLLGSKDVEEGLYITRELLPELVAGRPILTNLLESELFVQDRGGAPPRRLDVKNRQVSSPVYLSPNGRYLLVLTYLTEIPRHWAKYRNENDALDRSLRLDLPKHAPTGVKVYRVIDIDSGESRVLLDSPIEGWSSSPVLWSRDSQSIILSFVYPPFDRSCVDSTFSGSLRRVVAEIEVANLAFKEIAESERVSLSWDLTDDVLRLRERNHSKVQGERCFKKTADGWVDISRTGTCVLGGNPVVFADQDLNHPPQIVAFKPGTNQKVRLLDLNPQLAKLAFGEVRLIKWPLPGVKDRQAGLYLPPNYEPGKRYPLIIQTHGFEPDQFWMGGPYTTAMAAQPLASKGFVVLQVPDETDLRLTATPEEAPLMMRTYESAIDYLSAEGIVDKDRVGLVGFSHTCWFVKYTLTHSKYGFGAAVVADGYDGGYFQYIAFENQSEWTRSYEEKMTGAPPFGLGLELWLKRSPGFLLSEVHTPVLIQAISPPSVLSEWEWFAGLSRLKKPVDLLYFPEGFHELQKPKERLRSEQATVDWLSFWLKGEEDPDPAKLEVYRRWHELRRGQLDSISKKQE